MPFNYTNPTHSRRLASTAVAILLSLHMSTTAAQAAQQPESTEKWPELSSAVDAMYEGLQPHQTGGVTTVIHKGEVLHLKGYGAANRELNVPWTPDTVYLLASLTKSITASAILEVAEDGCVSLDDSLYEHLPEFPRFESDITLWHLLTMTSGLWQDELLMPLSGVTGAVSLEALYAMSLAQNELDFPPGSTFRYTDTNFRLLARIVTRCTGSADYEEALKKLLFSPLGMKSSSASWIYWAYQNGQVPTYLTVPGDGGPPLTLDIHVPTSGDGGVRTTMRDLIRWLLYMREGIDTGRSRWQRLDQPVQLADGSESNYRLGVYQVGHRGLSGISHGGITGTQYVFYPDIDLIIAVFQNDIGTFNSSDAIGRLTDAFLESPQFRQSHPEHETGPAALGGALAAANPELTKGVAGFYVAPGDGFILELVEPTPGRLSASYRGSPPLPLESLGTFRFRSPAGIRPAPMLITVSPGPTASVELQMAEWSRGRRLDRVEPSQSYDNELTWAEGFYYSAVLDTVYTLRHENGAYIMRIGSGRGPAQKFRLTRLTPEVFEAHAIDASYYDIALGLGRFGVKLLQPDSEAPGLRIITDRIRNIEFRKIAAAAQ